MAGPDMSYYTALAKQKRKDLGIPEPPAPGAQITYSPAPTPPPPTIATNSELPKRELVINKLTPAPAPDPVKPVADAARMENLNGAVAGYNQVQGQINSLGALVNNQANPYSMGNPGMMAQRALAANKINSGYKTAAQQLKAHLAQRGVLGTAQEDAALANYSLNNAKDISQADTELAAGSYDKQQGFEGQRVNRLADLIGMQNNLSTARAGFYSNLANLGIAQSSLDHTISNDTWSQNNTVSEQKRDQGNIEADRVYRAARDKITDANDKIQLDMLIKKFNDSQDDRAASQTIEGQIGQLLGKYGIPLATLATAFIPGVGLPLAATMSAATMGVSVNLNGGK